MSLPILSKRHAWTLLKERPEMTVPIFRVWGTAWGLPAKPNTALASMLSNELVPDQILDLIRLQRPMAVLDSTKTCRATNCRTLLRSPFHLAHNILCRSQTNGLPLFVAITTGRIIRGHVCSMTTRMTGCADTRT